MTLITTWHPTFALFRNPYEAGAFVLDMDRFARAIKGQLVAGPRRININPTAADVIAYHKRALRTGEYVAVDIETRPESGDSVGFTGKDPTRCRLKAVGLGFCDEGLSFIWREGLPSVRRALRNLLADQRVTKTFHNGDWFDLRVLSRYGIRVRSVFDTRDARRAVSSTSPLKLSHCASVYTDYVPWKENESDEEKGLVFTKSRRKLKIYNAHDCIVTARVEKGIRSEDDWSSPRVQRLYQVHRDLARIAGEMHTTGIKVDKLQRKWLGWALLQEYKEKEEKLIRTVGRKGFCAQPNHLRALIFQSAAVGKYAHLGMFDLPDPVDPAMYVDEKAMKTISVDEDALTLLLVSPDTPPALKEIIQLYWDAQEIWKMRSTFVVSKLVSQAIGHDGRLRAGWNSCGTDTGRFACGRPNLMNVLKVIRSMYVARQGWELVGADWSQLELWVMYAVAGDEVLGAALKAGDVYSEDAKSFFSLPANMTKCGCDGACLTPDRHIKSGARKAAKIIHLAKQYGAGKKKVFQQALKQDKRMDLLLSNTLCDRFDERYSGTVNYWDEEEARVLASDGMYSESRILQRRRYYPRAPERSETANYPVQATASDIKNLVLIDLDAKLKKYKMKTKILIDLHDAIYCESPNREVKAAGDLLEECMAQRKFRIGLRDFQFKVERKHAHRWSDCG